MGPLITPIIARRLVSWAFGLLTMVYSVNALPVETKENPIGRLPGPLKLDGKMGDPAWKLATRYEDFKTVHPEAGRTPSERTEVYLAYTATTLYVAIRSFDHEATKIRATAVSPKTAWKDDWAALCLNPYNDALNSLYFLVTPGNLRISGTLDDNNRPRFTLNLEWSSRATVIDDGWIAEMAIPLRSIPFQGSDLVSMSFKIARFIARKGEEVNLPEMKPGQREYEQYREISLHDVVRSTASWSDFYLKTLESLRRERLQVAKLPHEKQLEKWGDATTLDYLIFPSRELKQSSHPFHFKLVLEDQHVAASVATLEYAPGKEVSDLERFLNRTATTSFIVIKNDGIIYEKYFDGYRRDSIVTSFSVAKSFVSTLIGMAIDEGKIGSVNDSITRYLPELAQRDPRFNRITIRDLLLMSSGIRYHEADPNNDDDITYHAADLRRAALDSTVIVDEPGKHWHYNNYHPLLLGLILERVTGQSVTDYMQKKLWAPLGMEYSGSWSVNGNQNGLEKMESGINARAIDLAKLGRLLLNGGRWGGKQLLSENWIEQATQPDTKPASYYNDGPFFTSLGHYYSYFWWGSKRPGGKSDFCAVGNKGQYIYVSPQKSVIIVRSGFDYGIPNSRWLRLFYQLADRL